MSDGVPSVPGAAIQTGDDAGILLSRGGAFSDAEEAIVEQMADARVLAEPQRFPEANRDMVKAIEVLYRNGRRAGPLKGWGLLRPLVQLLQVYVTSFITSSYVKTLLRNMLALYVSRENQASKGSHEWHLLYYARWNLDKMDTHYSLDRATIPILLFEGAVLATTTSGFATLFAKIVDRDMILIGFSLCVLALVAAVGVGIVQSVGIAKRRIAMTTEQPLETLYAVVGGAGDPPRDIARAFAVGAIVVLVLIWLIIPGLLFSILF
jgi:hypothetical protein